MKKLARSVIRALISRAPWGVRDAVLDACIARFGPADVMARILPQLRIAELGVSGDLGLIRSAANDRAVLMAYGRSGGLEQVIVRTLQAFFAATGGTYMDVGANIGLTTIPIARNPMVRCIAFEPEPGNFNFLKLNVATNLEGNLVESHQIALLDRPGTVSLAIADGNLGDHRVSRTGIPGRRSVAVPAAPLDEFYDRIAGPLAIKVDTQGAEPFIVAGGQKVLSRAGLLAIEFCPFLMRQMGGDPNIVVELISQFDQIALTEAGADAEPVFLSPAEAEAALRRKLQTARDIDDDYVDVIAKRSR